MSGEEAVFNPSTNKLADPIETDTRIDDLIPMLNFIGVGIADINRNLIAIEAAILGADTPSSPE